MLAAGLTNAAHNTAVHFARRRALALIVILCLAFQALGTAFANPLTGAQVASDVHHASADGCTSDHDGMPCGATHHDCHSAHSCTAFALVAAGATLFTPRDYPGFPDLKRRCTDRVPALDVPPPLTVPA